MRYSDYPTKIVIVCGLMFALNVNVLFANPDDPAELESFETVVQRMRGNTEKIKALKNSGKVIGHERGLLDPVNNANLSPDEQMMLDQENKDRSEYFAFLARNSSAIYRHEQPPMLDKSGVTYPQVAQYLAKKWKEWPPKQ